MIPNILHKSFEQKTFYMLHFHLLVQISILNNMLMKFISGTKWKWKGWNVIVSNSAGQLTFSYRFSASIREQSIQSLKLVKQPG